MIAFEQGIRFSEGLWILVDNNRPAGCTVPFPMAFVLGTRTTDPNAGQQGQFAPSSHYMPAFMRVNPILVWTYGHIWHYLRTFQLPYCCLYDQGYTSLGTVLDTMPCPALAVAGYRDSNNNNASGTNNSSSTTSSNGIPKYWPAYMLRDYDQERAGRITKESSSSAANKQAEKKKVTTSSSTSSLGNLSAFSIVPTKGANYLNNNNNKDGAAAAAQKKSNMKTREEKIHLRAYPTIPIICKKRSVCW